MLCGYRNYQAEIYAFGKRLSEEFDEALLKQAFIDKSYVHKERVRREELGLEAKDIDLKDNSELREIGRDRLTSTLIMFIKKEFPKLPAEGLEYVSIVLKWIC
jgi:large subunit ribosomal protein L44